MGFSHSFEFFLKTGVGSRQLAVGKSGEEVLYFGLHVFPGLKIDNW